jgi:methyltransferase
MDVLTPQRWVTLGVLALIGAARLGELVLSAARLRADRRAGSAAALPERAFPWIVAVHTGWFAGAALEGWFAPTVLPGWALAAAWTAWGVSLALRAWLLASLGRLWSVRLVQRTAQPIVTRGPYAWVRHPNYLAVVLEIAAVPLIVGAAWTALLGSVANAAVVAVRIRREEGYLFAQPGYREAFEDKKRMIPGVF